MTAKRQARPAATTNKGGRSAEQRCAFEGFGKGILAANSGEFKNESGPHDLFIPNTGKEGHIGSFQI